MKILHRQSLKLFKVSVDFLSYKKIQPVQCLYQTSQGPREYFRLQVGWTDVFLDAFWEQHKLPCTFAIKNHSVSSSGRGNFIKFTGECKDSNCRVPFFGDIEDEPKVDENVFVNFYTTDTTNVEHSDNIKRFLHFTKRQIVGDEVDKIGATHWRRKYADSTMEYGDKQPPTLYKTSVLRKAKQNVVDNDLGVSKHNPILSLIELKHGAEHSNSIHTISCDKFFAHYWTPIQCHIYKEIRKNKWVTVYIDATGSLILPLKRTSNTLSSGHIFLYQMVTNNEGQTIPIAQQLSEKQDTLSIYYWLANWVSSGMKSPDECVCDYSKALLGAITRAFCNRMSLQEYSETCFKILKQLSVSNEVVCFVRIDVAHMVHMLCRWKCLKGRRLIKDFYVRSIGLLIQANSLDYFEQVLQNILILAMAEFDGYSDFNNVPAEDARIYLENLISNISDDYNAIDEEYKGISNDETFFCDPETLTEDFNDQPISIMEWIQNIKQISSDKAIIIGNRLNAYHCPDLVKPLLRICNEFPLWSGVMVDYFSSPNKIGSSARIEGYFSDLKSTVIDKRKPRLRVDKFLVNHLRSIRGLIKIAKSEMNDKNSNYINDNLEVNDIENSDDGDVDDNNYHGNDDSDNNDEDENTVGGENNDEDDGNVFDDDKCNEDPNSLDEMEYTNICHSNEIKELNEIENWKNKGTVTKKRKSLYLTKHPEIKAKRYTKSIYTIDNVCNGNFMKPSPTNKKSKIMYKVLNTCPFDAVLQSLATGYIDSVKYAEYIDNTQNKIMVLAKFLVEHGANSSFYMKRTNILESFGNKTKLICGLTELDCRYNVNNLLELLLKDEPSIWEYHTCNKEAKQTVVPRIFFPINLMELVKGM